MYDDNSVCAHMRVCVYLVNAIVSGTVVISRVRSNVLIICGSYFVLRINFLFNTGYMLYILKMEKFGRWNT